MASTRHLDLRKVDSLEFKGRDNAILNGNSGEPFPLSLLFSLSFNWQSGPDVFDAFNLFTNTIQAVNVHVGNPNAKKKDFLGQDAQFTKLTSTENWRNVPIYFWIHQIPKRDSGLRSLVRDVAWAIRSVNRCAIIFHTHSNHTFLERLNLECQNYTYMENVNLAIFQDDSGLEPLRTTVEYQFWLTFNSKMKISRIITAAYASSTAATSSGGAKSKMRDFGNSGGGGGGGDSEKSRGNVAPSFTLAFFDLTSNSLLGGRSYKQTRTMENRPDNLYMHLFGRMSPSTRHQLLDRTEGLLEHVNILRFDETCIVSREHLMLLKRMKRLQMVEFEHKDTPTPDVAAAAAAGTVQQPQQPFLPGWVLDSFPTTPKPVSIDVSMVNMTANVLRTLSYSRFTEYPITKMAIPDDLFDSQLNFQSSKEIERIRSAILFETYTEEYGVHLTAPNASNIPVARYYLQTSKPYAKFDLVWTLDHKSLFEPTTTTHELFDRQRWVRDHFRVQDLIKGIFGNV